MKAPDSSQLALNMGKTHRPAHSSTSQQFLPLVSNFWQLEPVHWLHDFVAASASERTLLEIQEHHKVFFWLEGMKCPFQPEEQAQGSGEGEVDS